MVRVILDEIVSRETLIGLEDEVEFCLFFLNGVYRLVLIAAKMALRWSILVSK